MTIPILAFCEPRGSGDTRSYLQAPMRQGNYIYATNGHAIVRVPAGAHDETPQESKIDLAKPCANAGIDAVDGWRPLPAGFALPPHGLPKCSGCRGSGDGPICKDCKGTGEHECDCDHCEEHCDYCNGAGIWLDHGAGFEPRQMCQLCHGRGRDHDRRAVVFRDGPILSAEYVAKVLALPGPIEVRWAPPQEDHHTKKLWHLTAAFRGPGWHAVIMAMRYGPGADREIIVEMDDMTA